MGSLIPTISSGKRSVPGCLSITTLTDRWTSISRTRAPARTTNQIGCRRPRAGSIVPCACKDPRSRQLPEGGIRRRSRGRKERWGNRLSEIVHGADAQAPALRQIFSSRRLITPFTHFSGSKFDDPKRVRSYADRPNCLKISRTDSLRLLSASENLGTFLASQRLSEVLWMQAVGPIAITGAVAVNNLLHSTAT